MKTNQEKIRNSTIKRTFRISTIEGVFAHVYGILVLNGNIFVTKLFLILGASPLHFSLLSAFAQFSAVFRPLGVAITHRLTQRKRTTIIVAGIGRFLTLFIGFSLLFHDPVNGIWFILILFLVSQGIQSIAGNIWIAWISDIIPTRIRGRFFSKRNQILLLVGLIVAYIVSFHVDLFEKNETSFKQLYLKLIGLQDYFLLQNQAKFLGGLFVAASLIGLFGLYFLNKQPEKSKYLKSSDSLRKIYSAPFRDKNFRLLLLFGVWWMMAVGIGSAFWGPFMLKKLNMSMFEIQIYGSLSTFAALLSYTFWGKFIDRFGNKTTMMICVFLGGVNPMLWLFMTAGNHSIIWFEAFSAGFMWSATGIVMTNFVLSIAKKRQEQVYSGLFGAITGLSMMTSTLLSGVFFPKTNNLLGFTLEPEQIVFAVGAVARWTAIIPLIFVQERAFRPLRELWINFFGYAKFKISQLRDFKY
ncbi:MAG: MFS transporter [Candidatus Cloacimonadales bacterium]|nr:MFS transporter [Candidatus Cloacimonadales bacterium]